jgi:hypothetical protein
MGGLLAWRAGSQSITYDEAFTWLGFVSRPLGEVFTSYTANNHVLFTLLAWITTRAFGTSELTVRLPSVVAGIAYASLSFHVSCVVSDRWTLRVLTTAAMVLNPFTLDFFVAARGYGLATTCLVAALLLVMRPREQTERTLALTGALVGLSVAANLAYAFPAAGVSAAAAVLAALRSAQLLRVLVRSAATILIASTLTSMPLLIVPLRHRPPRNAFFFGAPTFLDSSRSLVTASLQYDPHSRWFAPDWVIDVLSAWAVPLLVVACVITACVIALRARGRKTPRIADSAVPVVAIGTTLGVTVAALAVARIAFHLPLPFERTGLYWLALLPLTVAALARVFASTPGRDVRGLRRAFGTPLLLLLLAYAGQFTTTHFRSWRYDAGTRDMFAVIERWPCPPSHRWVIGGTPFRFAPALEFYRVVRDASHVAAMDILGAPYASSDPDFYVAEPLQERELRSDQFLPVMTHPVSGATLFARRDIVQCARPPL